MRRYSHEHIAIESLDGGRTRLSLSDFMRRALGEPVALEFRMPGTRVDAGAVVGRAEGRRRTCQLYAPFALTVLQAEADAVLVTPAAELPQLLDEAAYAAHAAALAPALR